MTRRGSRRRRARGARGTSISASRSSAPSAAIDAELARHRTSIASASASSTRADVVTMAESPAAALRRKPRASIKVAAEAVARGEAAALFSAGHTGATVMAATARSACCRASIVRRWRRRFRRRRDPAVLLDVGASVECRPHHLLQFAVMGSVYARVAFGIEAPRVGLLSIGEEETKGNELTREAHRLLKASPLAFHRQRRSARRLQRHAPTSSSATGSPATSR